MGYEIKGNILSESQIQRGFEIQVLYSNDLSFISDSRTIFLNSDAVFTIKRDGSYIITCSTHIEEEHEPSEIRIFISDPTSDESDEITLVCKWEKQKLEEDIPAEVASGWDAEKGKAIIPTDSGITIVISAKHEEPSPRKNRP